MQVDLWSMVILPGRLASNLQVLKPLKPVYEAWGVVDKNAQTLPLLTIFVFYNRKTFMSVKKLEESLKTDKTDSVHNYTLVYSYL
jgi:hypothetical protein